MAACLKKTHKPFSKEFANFVAGRLLNNHRISLHEILEDDNAIILGISGLR